MQAHRHVEATTHLKGNTLPVQSPGGAELGQHLDSHLCKRPSNGFFTPRLVPHRSVAPKRPAAQPTCCVPRGANLQGSCSQGFRMPAIGHMHTSSSASGSAGLLAPHGRGPAPFRPHNAPAAAGTTRPRAVPSASPAPQRSAIAQQQRRAVQPARAAAVDVAAPAPTPSAQPAPARPAGNPSAPTFQQAITKLQEYWASVGCAIYLPHNTEVGAGTMNPATFLRVLGPEPWNVAYPEPSIRPDDSRYGDNPNRLQRHTQFQVILKPDPGNSQVTTQPAGMPVQCSQSRAGHACAHGQSAGA